MEIQTESKKSLPKRTRYYQGMIDLHILEKGEDYASLKTVLDAIDAHPDWDDEQVAENVDFE